jgi:hypothetical protein
MLDEHKQHKNAEDLIDSGKEVGIEVNAEKTKYMFMSYHQNAGQNHNVKMANNSFENITQFKHLGMKIIHQYCIH